MDAFLERLKKVVSENYKADVSCVESANRYLFHYFDVLGSGSTKLYYGMTPDGPDGYTFRNPQDNYEDTFSAAVQAAPEREKYLKSARELCNLYVPGFCPIPWHTDIKTGYVYDTVWHTRVPVSKIPGVDAKMPSDLARGHNLLTLASAYRVTGDRKYRSEAIAQLLDWISVCPPFYTPSWRNGMNVSVRAANIICSMALLDLDENDVLDERFLPILKKCLEDHRHHVSLTIEIYRSHNHITAELAGLTLMCALLGQEESADFEAMESFAWGRYAWMQLNKEITAQLQSDGFDFENSSSYHAYVLEMMLYPPLHAARIAGCKTAGDCREYLVARERYSAENFEKLRKGAMALKAITQPDGSIPFVGDNDSGRYIMWEKETPTNDRRSLSCVLAVLFDDFSLLPASVSEDDFLAAKAFFDDVTLPDEKQWKEIKKPSVQAEMFENGGYISLAEAGFKGLLHISAGGHCHNDQLGITLFVDGKSIVVDPGTYSYTGNAEWRKKLRSIKVHSTIVVDDQETDRFVAENMFGGNAADVPFSIFPITRKDGIISGGAEHKAWRRLSDRITVRRMISWNREGTFSVEDSIFRETQAPLEGKITERFALHPACSVKVLSEKEAEIDREGTILHVSTQNGSFSVEDAVYSAAYGMKTESKNLTVTLARDAEKNRIEFRF